MKRIYSYKGFEISVEPEPVLDTTTRVTVLQTQGFVAVVHIRLPGATRLMVAPIRLTGDGQRPFPTEPEALMTGFSAAQRVVDDMFID
jgi:hypothetical protein